MSPPPAHLRPFAGVLPELAPGAWVDPAAVVIGAVTLGPDASVWPGAVLRGDVERIRVGARSNIQDGAIVHVTHDGPWTPGGRACEIGADVTVGHGAILHACTVGDSCLIGMHATVLDDAVIGPRSLLGAGALVVPGTQIGSEELWFGNPARRVRALRADEIEQLAYSAAHYVRLKREHERALDAPD